MLYNWNTTYFCSSYVLCVCSRLPSQVLTNAVQLEHNVFLFQLCSVRLFQTSITSINQCCTIGTQRISVPVDNLFLFQTSSTSINQCCTIGSQRISVPVDNLFLFQTSSTSINQCCIIGTQRISVPVMFCASVPDFHHKYYPMLYNWNTAYFCSSYVLCVCSRLPSQVLTNALQLEHNVFLFQLCSVRLFQTSITRMNQCSTIGTQRISVPVMFCASVPDFHHKY